MNFGRRVGELRRARGWTKARLAEEWGVTLRYVQLGEGRRENLKIESLALLAGVLRAHTFESPKPPSSIARRRPERPRKS